jgi:hypothetical protein
MFESPPKPYTEVLDLLDRLSGSVRAKLGDFRPFVDRAALQNNAKISLRSQQVVELASAFILITLAVIISRSAQYAAMLDSMGEYFLPGLINVSTTHDAGFYFSQAQQWALRFQGAWTIFNIAPGELPGFLLAMLSDGFDIDLSAAARIMVYASVTLTACATYTYLRSLNQATLGLFVATTLVSFFPFYSRTSIGMMDTDLLNLFFILSIISALIWSSKSASLRVSLFGLTVAGILSLTFYFWYPRPGFLLGFVSIYVALMLSERMEFKKIVSLVFIYLIITSYFYLPNALESVSSFYQVYVSNPVNEVASAKPHSDIIYGAIGEKLTLNIGMIENDFGHIEIFFLSLFGVFIWILQDWKRVIPSALMLAFVYLYLVGGVRFAFYASPLFIIGIACFFLAASRMIALGYGRLRNRVLKTKPVRDPAEDPNMPRFLASPLSQLMLLAALFVIAWPIGFLPPSGVVPPPVISAENLQPLKVLNEHYKDRKVIIASWWDYGHELGYQTGRKVLTNGANPADIQSLYIARALVAKDPGVAADELRFASYFERAVLEGSYPDRPSTKAAKEIDQDIWLILPSDMPQKMWVVSKVASSGSPANKNDAAAPGERAFDILFTRAPNDWGQFIKLYKSPNGMTIYALPGLRENRP